MSLLAKALSTVIDVHLGKLEPWPRLLNADVAPANGRGTVHGDGVGTARADGAANGVGDRDGRLAVGALRLADPHGDAVEAVGVGGGPAPLFNHHLADFLNW